MIRLEYNDKSYWGFVSQVGQECLVSASASLVDSLTMDTLEVDTLTAVVQDTSLQPILLVDSAGRVLADAEGAILCAQRAATGLTTYTYAAPVKLFSGSTMVGYFYLESIKRLARYQFQLNCVSGVGLLMTDNHYGGVYDGETLAEIVKDIINGIVSYSLDDELGSTKMFGWLPKGTRRDNLRDVLFAAGGQIRKTSTGEISIIPLTAGTAYEIAPANIYIGGSTTGGNPATEVRITEHAYIAREDDETTTLFDGDAAAETMTTPTGKSVVGVLVEFSEPMHSLSADNVGILERGANYAVLGQSPAALLTGKKYTHTERIITRKKSTGGAANVVTSDACTMVNLLNAENVADRVMAFYGEGETASMDVVLDGQKPGDAVTYTSPFMEDGSGYISGMTVNYSATSKARLEIVTGFVPSSWGNYYGSETLFTASGTFTVPDTCKGKIRVVMIGGGDGGEAGDFGEDGETLSVFDALSTYWGESGKGGAGGAGGKGGKIYVATLSVSVGQAFQVTIGAGGSYGYYEQSTVDGVTTTYTKKDPTEGGATLFGDLTTANGYSSDTGYKDLLSGSSGYGMPGQDGYAGEGGGYFTTTTSGSSTITTYIKTKWSYPDFPVAFYAGEKGKDEVYESQNNRASGGLGGGPTGAGNGGDGTDGYAKYDGALGGDGGDGANGFYGTVGMFPGCGGMGGSGGGGGGGGGNGLPGGANYCNPGKGGKGGQGGHGGAGADGMVLVYY